jgi:hypothetical protein
MKSASNVKGINRIAVIVVILILIWGWMSRQLLELQRLHKGIANMNTSQ